MSRNFLAFSHNSLLYSLILRSVRGSLFWSFKTFSVNSLWSFVMHWMSCWISLCFRMKPKCLSVWNSGKCHMVSGNWAIQLTYLLEAESFVWIRKFGITISTYVHMFIEFFHFTSWKEWLWMFFLHFWWTSNIEEMRIGRKMNNRVKAHHLGLPSLEIVGWC